MNVWTENDPLDWVNLPHLSYWSCMYMSGHSDFAKQAMTMPDETFLPTEYMEVPKKYRDLVQTLAGREKLSDPDFVAMTCRGGRPGILVGWYKT